MAKLHPKITPRKPTVPAPVERFVSGGGGSRSEVTRRDGRQLRRVPIYLPVELARRFITYCAERDMQWSDVMTKWIEEKLPASEK